MRKPPKYLLAKQLKEFVNKIPDDAPLAIAGPDHSYLPVKIVIMNGRVFNNGVLYEDSGPMQGDDPGKPLKFVLFDKV